MTSFEEDIFKKGSTTYYFSSKFFPKKTRQAVLELYSFVRTADNYVDAIPQDKDAFKALRKQWKQPKAHGDALQIRVVQNMRAVQNAYHIEEAWVEAFLDAMQSDMNKKVYTSLEDSLGYVYGSAEVIGLMMARIMRLDDDAATAARMQGRAMQWINFIRDIAEDETLGRQYFPASVLKKYGLKSLSKETAQTNPEAFIACVRAEIDRYRAWQNEANTGYRFVPYRYRIPLKTARDMYDWTANVIYKNPFVVFDQKVKPSKWRVIARAMRNVL